MPYYSRCNALYGGLYCVRGIEEYTPPILCPLWGVLLRCGLYALQAVTRAGRVRESLTPSRVAVVWV